MTNFQRISNRIEYIKSVYMKPDGQGEYDELPFFDEAGILSSTENRKVLDKLSVLLVIYGADGAEWSISPMGKRFICREIPRRGRFHKHEYVEILYVIEGSFTQILLGEEIRFEQGEFVITDQNCEHADYIEAKDAAVIFLQIRADYLEQLLKSYDGTDEMQQFLFHALWRQKREQSFLELRKTEADCNLQFDMEQLLEFLVSEDLAREPGYEKIEQGLMIRLLQHLCQDYTLQLHTDSRESREKALLYELECYIRTNAATVTVAELEKRFHYHRNYYHLILKKYRGKSFQQYVIEIRMKYAKQLLEQTALPIKRIAQQVGYENISYFYRLFEKHFGKTPKDIRQDSVLNSTR
ncbi:MAG: AraC family transcriptional regulator [Lachnospiraceae bacterium]|nr:AraC family transcriptional regulator [Lachnospiraceae bacterium]